MNPATEYRQLTEAIRDAVGPRRAWTAEDIQAMLPKYADVLDQALREGELSENEVTEVLKTILSTLYELRAQEQVDAALKYEYP